MDDDAPFARREGEEEIFSYIREPGEFRHPAEGAEGADDDDGSEFLNDHGPGMEPDQRNNEYDEDSEIGGPTPSGEVY